MNEGVRTNENVDKLIGSDLVFSMVNFVLQVAVGIRQTSSRIMTSQLCNLSEDRSKSRQVRLEGMYSSPRLSGSFFRRSW